MEFDLLCANARSSTRFLKLRNLLQCKNKIISTTIIESEKCIIDFKILVNND